MEEGQGVGYEGWGWVNAGNCNTDTARNKPEVTIANRHRIKSKSLKTN